MVGNVGFFLAPNKNSSTPNINFKIATLPMFIFLLLWFVMFFLYTSFFILGELLLRCCDWFGGGTSS